ncbi:MAG TPA: isoprenylcysteine carboxylmethyltransferase family protein [Myxococcota bacterium]|nr:isoprenylcysteine carboxylmethyltransferase family protein [Myxococcota bacterium]
MARRISIFVFGVLSYALFFGVFLYAAGFMTNLFVPKSLDSGPAPGVVTALAVNFGLLAIFALQHSVMARPAFKRWWTRIVPSEAERSVYVLASSVAMIALFAFWQPLPGAVFELEHPALRALAYGVCALGYLIVLYSTFLIDHFDLFGLRQSWLALRAIPYTPHPFRTPSLYRYVRHPLYVGWLLFFWATPVMTVGHLLIALGITGYILIAIVFEERDLLQHFGADYRAWRARTPLLIPRLRKRAAKPRSRGVAEPA